ncbi:hypothetical protein G7B40_036060 [Aetokthonos hydrillicola Thurmond2011]|uniref:Uncharacterized protein n=1 Tax=Aetokthonos hydrillicola Thurmond2011 TaxID=2712845 RepID=A0AAP5MC45_9CYAN|nr:hypothetical protein [Aetokthonos hydrillicola]MBW4586362.1 hypothetical protein [Aetokthonos hydrillicola CCALA 1050]MDR9899930.1 hypothetical protein [Aetokthonos hydrillicola Thurmond2011]
MLRSHLAVDGLVVDLIIRTRVERQCKLSIFEDSGIALPHRDTICSMAIASRTTYSI